jgi:uncharacterized protein YdbL (DUF1318 family)
MFKKTLIAAALAVAASGSFAQVYVEGALGQGTVNQAWAGATSSKKTSSGNKFVVGYDINKSWSAELQMLNYGKATASAGANSADAKVTGTGIGGYWNLNGDKWGFKVGAAYVMTKNAETQTGTANTTTNNNSIGLGVGGSYKFTDSLALTFGLDTATFKASGTTGTGGASLLSVGLRAKF